MNRLTKTALVLTTLLVTLPVFADTNQGTSKPPLRALARRADNVEQSTDNRIERVETKMANRASTSVEFMAKADTKRLEMTKKYAENMLRVHKAAINRLVKLADRIASRIAKIETEKGINMDASEAKLAIARTKIVTAETYVNGIMTQVNSATGTPAQVKTTVMGYFATSRENLKLAHQALVDVISSMKLGLGM